MSYPGSHLSDKNGLARQGWGGGAPILLSGVPACLQHQYSGAQHGMSFSFFVRSMYPQPPSECRDASLVCGCAKQISSLSRLLRSLAFAVVRSADILCINSERTRQPGQEGTKCTYTLGPCTAYYRRRHVTAAVPIAPPFEKNLSLSLSLSITLSCAHLGGGDAAGTSAGRTTTQESCAAVCTIPNFLVPIRTAATTAAAAAAAVEAYLSVCLPACMPSLAPPSRPSISSPSFSQRLSHQLDDVQSLLGEVSLPLGRRSLCLRVLVAAESAHHKLSQQIRSSGGRPPHVIHQVHRLRLKSGPFRRFLIGDPSDRSRENAHVS